MNGIVFEYKLNAQHAPDVLVQFLFLNQHLRTIWKVKLQLDLTCYASTQLIYSFHTA